MVTKFLSCALGLTLCSAFGCNRPAIDTTSSTSKAAESWIRLGPNPPSRGILLDSSRLRVVAGLNEATALSLLEVKPWTQLTDAEAGQLLSFPALRSFDGSKPYLLRAIGSPAARTGFEVELETKGEVWVSGHVLSHHAVPIQRRAIVAWLDQPPRELYVSFSVAE